PTPPPPNPPVAGHETGAESQPPLKPPPKPKPKEDPPMSQSKIDAENEAYRQRFPKGYETPPVRPGPGDGEVVEMHQVFEEMGKKDGVVLESGSHAWHRDLWHRAGKTGEPPAAFKFADKIRVDLERLPKDQREIWIELDRARDAASGGNKYPPRP